MAPCEVETLTCAGTAGLFMAATGRPQPQRMISAVPPTTTHAGFAPQSSASILAVVLEAFGRFRKRMLLFLDGAVRVRRSVHNGARLETPPIRSKDSVSAAQFPTV